MLPIERIYKIKELVKSRHHIKISDLSSELGVSKMTVHRDVKPLIDEGFVLKTFGGITLAHENIKEEKDHSCIYCNRDLHKRLAYQLILTNNNIEMACCAHCGLLRQQQINDDVTHSICQDFLMGTTISASLATYAMDTSIKMRCCQPQVLAFEYKNDAKKFIKGFGGTIYSFSEAMALVYKRMSGDINDCHS